MWSDNQVDFIGMNITGLHSGKQAINKPSQQQVKQKKQVVALIPLAKKRVVGRQNYVY